MARRKDEIEEAVSETGVPPVETAAQPAGPPGPKPGMVRVEHLKPGNLDITMPNGTNVHLGPWSKAGERHISDPLSKREVMKVAVALLRSGRIRLREEG